MNRLTAFCIAATMVAAVAQAQTPPTQPAPQPKPKPGMIIDRPDSGRITSDPNATTPAPKPSSSNAPATNRIERFEASGNTSVASDTIRVYLGINPGDAYNPEAIQKNFTNLWQTGLFDDIRIETDRGENGGVVIRVIVKERPRIGAVEYRGNKELNTTKITEALEKEKIDIHVGNTIEQTLVRRAAEAIKHAYSEGGFEGVTVDSSTEDMPEPGEKKIVFNINEGVKAKVAQIDFVGNQRFSDRRLRAQMKEVKPNGIISWVRKKNLYIPSKLDEDLERVKNYYQDYGYQNIAFGDPQIITVKGKRPRVKIVIPVKEGVVHHFGEVTVTGNTIFTKEQIVGNWPIKKGDVIRRKPIQARLDNFNDAYRAHGYIYAYINPEYVEKENDVVDVHIQIYEGDQFRLGRLEFQGNTTTKDKVLRREIFLEEGDIMNMETFKASIYKLGQLGYYKVNDNPDFKVNQEKKTVDVLVKGNEEGKNDVQFGGGYSEGTGFFIQTQFSTRNFLGEGENLGLSFQRGNRQNFFSLSYADPWFLDTPNSLGMSIFNRNTHFPLSFGYEERSRGGSVAYGYRLHRFDSISLVYGFEKVRSHQEFNTAPDINGNVPIADIQDFNYTSSSLGPSYGYDSRDNPFDPTRGFRFNLGTLLAGGPFGGSIHMFRPTLGITKFFKLTRNTSWSVNTELGWMQPLHKDCANSLDEATSKSLNLCVPKGQRFFVGGEYSVRGFEYGSLGPTETFGGQSLIAGGYKQTIFNTEYIIKLSDPIRLVFFGDAGMAYGHEERVDLGKLRFSTGAELRVFLPVFQFPIRFIYALNPIDKPGDKFQSFQFTIGNTY
jgi:outer membrane protein insertion porin family